MNVITSTYHSTSEQIAIEENQIREAQNDMKKFSILYDRYYIRIFRFVFQRVESEELAADITSQVFTNAMLHLRNYKMKGLPFGSWLFRIARNEVNMHYRKESKQRYVYAKTDDLHQIIDEIEEDNTEERITKMMTALGQLTPDDMEMIEVRFFEHRSFKEVAEIFDLTETNAKVRVFRILKKLKKVLTP